MSGSGASFFFCDMICNTGECVNAKNRFLFAEWRNSNILHVVCLFRFRFRGTDWAGQCLIEGAKERIVLDTSSTYTSLAEVPDDIATIHPELWTYAFYESAKEADYDINRISVIRRVSKDVDVIRLMRHEPFRMKHDRDKRIIYNWQCTCEHGLRKGFCGRQTRKPLSVYVRNLNGNRARVGIPPTRISAALSIE